MNGTKTKKRQKQLIQKVKDLIDGKQIQYELSRGSLTVYKKIDDYKFWKLELEQIKVDLEIQKFVSLTAVTADKDLEFLQEQNARRIALELLEIETLIAALVLLIAKEEHNQLLTELLSDNHSDFVKHALGWNDRHLWHPGHTIHLESV